MISIGVVARLTGVEVSTLRKWESRYGFPNPVRRASGQRVYRPEDVAGVQAVVRQISGGQRVGTAISTLLQAIAPPSGKPGSRSVPSRDALIDKALGAICASDMTTLSKLMAQARTGRGVRAFVEQFAAPLSYAVGEAWAAGTLLAHCEHVFSTLMERQLNKDIADISLSGAPRLLLTCAAGEKHTLGIAMTQAVLTEAGVSCLRLSSDLPVAEIVACCEAHAIAVLGLSASRHYPPRLLHRQIVALREQLSPDVGLWVGGGGTGRLTRLPIGVRTFHDYPELLEATKPLAHKQNRHAS